MNTKQEFNCVFCNDGFETKEDLQEHFRKHGDPNFKKIPEVDSQVSNDKSKEKVEMINCDVCTQVFPSISKAITHKHKVHPDHDAKYFCPWCGKLFTMKHLYSVHVQSSHKDQVDTPDKCYRCDYCCVDFFTPSAMMNHNKFFHRQDSDLPDVGHSKKFKMHNQEVLLIYYCAFCGEEYENKVNLIKHITEDHNDENQSPEEVLKCPLCEAIFYHLDAYEIHLTFHTADDLYSVQNDEFGDIVEFSLESVPPMIEKIEPMEFGGENLEADPESAINSVGIDKFLELAIDQSEDSNPTKVKKHKKRKKSKKSAITLDEFLSMNQDVFGEGLDFQGIEEVPTRVVKKHLKIKKAPTNCVTSAKINKLKKAGIVIKKNVGKNPTLTIQKETSSMPPIKKSDQNESLKINKEQEITTSSEVLTKLMNQSNNQIRIVKKSNNLSIEPKLLPKDIPVSATDNETAHENTGVIESKQDDEHTENIASPKPDNSSSEMLNKLINQSNNQIKIVKKANIPSSETKSKDVPDNDGIKAHDTEIDIRNNEAKAIVTLKPDDSSSEVLSKLINQSNNQIKIIKKTNNTSNEPKVLPKDVNVSKNEPEDYDEPNNTTDILNAEKTKEGTKDLSQKHAQNMSDIHQTNDENVSNKQTPSNICVKDENSEVESNLSLSSPNYKEEDKEIRDNNSSDQEFDETGHEFEDEDDTPKEDNLQKSKSTGEKPESNVDRKHDFSNTSLKTLKHLSHHITVKPVTQNKTITQPESTNNEISDTEKIKDDERTQKIKNNMVISKEKAGPSRQKLAVDPSLDALKNLSKNITIKSMPMKRHIEEMKSKEDKKEENLQTKSNELKLKDVSGNKNLTVKKMKVEVNEIDNTLQEHKLQLEKLNVKKSLPAVKPKTIADNTSNNDMMTSNANILKRLSNITSKHIVSKNVSEINKESNSTKQIVKTEDKKEEIIEIFDIDDSEDEAETSNNQSNQSSVKPQDAFKHLSKNITIKSLNHQPQNIKIENIKVEKQYEDNHNRNNNTAKVEREVNMQNRNMAHKNILQGISKNITVKSTNSSPSHSIKSQVDHNSIDHAPEMEEESECDEPGKIQITEMDDDDMIDNDDSERIDESNINDNDPLVEAPDDSCSNDEQYFPPHDFEDDIEVNTVQNNNFNINSTCLKNISKNITIKSIGKSSITKDDVNNTIQIQENKKILPEKSNKLIIKEPHNENNTSINTKKIIQNMDNTSLQCVTQKKSAVNQVNTINKEVTVKTIHTKTVVQEITTTVTKTIKTVNQTVKQEVRSICQANSITGTQRVQSVRPSPAKNLQGVVIRHAPPNLGARIANSVPQIRPQSNTVRPPRQVNPGRTGSNAMRVNNPRMVIGKKISPSSNTNSSPVGRPLKISPTAMIGGNAKRPSPEDVSGPFSCFKKPKESLIPVSDVPSFSSSGGDSGAQFSAASHASSSHFTSTTKTIKGNSVVTAKQVKSDVSTMQNSRVSNSSGIKSMSSQAIQSQVCDKSETSAVKRTTLEAIQRLQKQGLLIKKPRLNNDSGSDDDGNKS